MNDECEMEKKCEDQICEFNSGNEYVGIHWGSMNDAKALCNQPRMKYSTFGILQHWFSVSQVFTFVKVGTSITLKKNHAIDEEISIMWIFTLHQHLTTSSYLHKMIQ